MQDIRLVAMILAAGTCGVLQATEASRLPAFVNSLGMQMVRMEAGTFIMGAEPGPDCLKPHHDYDGPQWDETPVCEVMITYVFSMARREISRAEFAEFRRGYRT